MPNLIPAGVLADLRTIVSDASPATALIARTSASLACRVNTTPKAVRLEGLPFYLHRLQWDITFAWNADVQDQDVLTVAGIEYVALTVERNNSYEVSRTALCPQTTYSSTSKLPVPPNAVVTFTNPLAAAGVGSITADVYTAPVDHDVTVYGLDPAFKRVVVFDPALAYSDGSLVEAGHEIRSAVSLGTKADGVTPRKAALSSPRRTIGMLAMATAYFREPA